MYTALTQRHTTAIKGTSDLGSAQVTALETCLSCNRKHALTLTLATRAVLPKMKSSCPTSGMNWPWVVNDRVSPELPMRRMMVFTAGTSNMRDAVAIASTQKKKPRK